MITKEQVEAAAFQIHCELGTTITAARVAARLSLTAAIARPAPSGDDRKRAWKLIEDLRNWFEADVDGDGVWCPPEAIDVVVAAFAARPAQAEEGWKPIETAPKAPIDTMETIDVLVYYAGGFIEVMYWADGWWPTNHDVDVAWSEPDHWRPLPEPPVASPLAADPTARPAPSGADYTDAEVTRGLKDAADDEDIEARELPRDALAADGERAAGKEG